MERALLEVSRIDVYYGQVQALSGVSFTVKEKEIISIIGPNGAGKSTTLKTLSGLLTPKSGKMYFQDQDISQLEPHHIVELGISHVPEGRRIFPRMRVIDNLELGAYTARARNGLASTLDWLFAIFPVLKERRSQLAGTLSGGEQQMLAIARALMSKPKILMLDEPSLGLAPLMVKKMYESIAQMHKSGVTILLVEQNIGHALRLADRAYLMERGKIVKEGKGQELLRDPYVVSTYLGV